MASDFGNASVKRERNITINWSNTALAIIQSDTYAFYTCKAMEYAAEDAYTYRNVRIVSQYIFMGWRCFSLGAGRRLDFGYGRSLRGFGEEFEDSVFLR